MTVVELKQAILSGALSDELLVLVAPEARYLANQYIDEICSVKGLNKVSLDSLADAIPDGIDMLLDNDLTLKVVSVDVFDEDCDDPTAYNNTILLCNKIKNKKTANKLSRFTVEFPKPETWATVAFLRAKYPNIALDKRDACGLNILERLLAAADDDVYRAISELDKVATFEPDRQFDVLVDILNEPNSDLFKDNFNDFIDDLFNKQINTRLKDDPKTKKKVSVPGLADFMLHRDVCDLEPVGIIQRLLTKYKGMLLAALTDCNADDLEVSPQYYKFLKGSTYKSNIDVDYYRDKIKFLSSIDRRLKLGEIDLPKDLLLDYVVCQILY